MSTNKKYYWLKLKNDFFEEKYIKALRRLPNGDSLVIIYLKMQLKSLKTEGFIKYEGVFENAVEELAVFLDEEITSVETVVDMLTKFGIIERLEDNSFYLSAMQNSIGTESDSAERVRRYREQQTKPNALHCNGVALHCNSDVTKCNNNVQKCNTEIEKEIDIDKDIKKENIKRKKERTKSYDDILSSLSDESLKALYYDFIKMRQLIKAPMSDRALTTLINRVNKISSGNTEKQKELLETAILNNWKSVYISNTNNNKPTNDNNRFCQSTPEQEGDLPF